MKDINNLIRIYDLDNIVGLHYGEFISMMTDMVHLHCSFTGFEKMDYSIIAS